MNCEGFWQENPSDTWSHANNLPEWPDIPLLLEFVRGDDPNNQVANSISNEVAQFCDNPATFPISRNGQKKTGFFTQMKKGKF